MPKRYKKLRGYLDMCDYDQPYVAERLGRSVAYVSLRYTGNKPWVQDDMYALMDMIERPYSELHEIFPPNGIDQEKDKKDADRTRFKIVRIGGSR